MPILNEEIMETDINGKTIYEIDVQEDYIHILFTDGSVLEVRPKEVTYGNPYAASSESFLELESEYTTAKELGYCHHEELDLPIPSKS